MTCLHHRKVYKIVANLSRIRSISGNFTQILGQDFYQTYARITGNQGFAQIFLGPFLALNTGNKQKISREALFLFRAKVGLRETLVIVPSEIPLFQCWETDFYPVPVLGELCSPYEVARPQPSAG